MRGISKVGLFDMEDVEDMKEIGKLLASRNVHDHEHHVGFTPMGGCKVLMFYRIQNPQDFDTPEVDIEHGDS